MAFGIAGDADLERRGLAQPLDQIRGRGITQFMRLIRSAHAGHVAAQGDEMADARVPVTAHDLVDLAPGMARACEMRGWLEPGLLDDALDGRMRAFARGAACAIGDRDERRRQRLEPADGAPQRLFGFRRFRRREFEGDRDRPPVGDEFAEAHAASACAFAAASASQIFTVSLFLPAAIASLATGLRPAAWNQPCTSRSAKPSRRWAKSLRRNSKSCGATSAIKRRPPARITRAVSPTAAAGSSR